MISYIAEVVNAMGTLHFNFQWCNLNPTKNDVAAYFTKMIALFADLFRGSRD